jgi:hypothetical protein
VNTCYKHFYYFVTEFDLIHEKAESVNCPRTIRNRVLVLIFPDPGSKMEKNPDPGSEINISDHISESLVSIFWVKIINSSVNSVLQIRIRNLGWKNPDTGLDPGSATLPPTLFSISGRRCGHRG